MHTVLLLLALFASAGAGFATEGRAWGDIHVETIDGASYDFQVAGEFVASRSQAGDLEVQLRLESAGFPGNVSIATAVAALVDTTRLSVALGREPLLHVDDQPTELDHSGLELPDGGSIVPLKRGYEVHWSDGSVMSIKVHKRHLNVFLRPAASRRGTLSGLFGNFNGISADDVVAPSRGLGSITLDDKPLDLAGVAAGLLGGQAEDFLLAQEASLFEYEPGQSTKTFRRPRPALEATPSSLPASWRRRAEEACKEAGVTEPAYLKACVVDVGYTRDESFAASAAAVQARDALERDAEAVRQADAGR
jgi:hypothetical protein